VANQTFCVTPFAAENREEAEWMRDVLCVALEKIVEDEIVRRVETRGERMMGSNFGGMREKAAAERREVETGSSQVTDKPILHGLWYDDPATPEGKYLVKRRSRSTSRPSRRLSSGMSRRCHRPRQKRPEDERGPATGLLGPLFSLS
jgi:hypothetical protein